MQTHEDNTQAPESQDVLGIERVALGATLRQAREHEGLSIEQLSQKTCIRPAYLRALEEERFEDLPGNTYGRGFLRLLARFLDVDAEQVVVSFNQAVGEQEARPEMDIFAHKAPLSRVRSKRRWPWVLLVLLLLAAAAGAAWWFWLRPDPVASELQPQTSQADRQTPQPVQEAPQVALPQGPAHLIEVPQQVQELRLTATETCSIWARVDETPVQQHRLQADESLAWRFREKVELNISAATAVSLTAGGEQLNTEGHEHLLIRATPLANNG